MHVLWAAIILSSNLASADANINNPEFEYGQAGWQVNAAATIINSYEMGGTKAMRVLTGGVASQDVIDFKPGDNYRASVWAKVGNKTQAAEMVARTYDVNGNLLSEKSVNIKSMDFAQHNLDFSIPYSAKNVKLFLSKEAGTYSFAVFDQLSIIKDTWSPALLRWAPPKLVNPTTIQLGTGQSGVKLDNNKDYIIKFPAAKKVGGTALFGGRNIVIMGGHVTIPAENTGKGGNLQRALFITGNQGTVHVEGLLVDGSGGGESDAIAIESPNSIVQIQNLRVNGIIGSNNTWHADMVQPWGGVKELRIDRLTGSSYYQGLQIPEDKGAIGKSIVSHVNMSILTPSSGVSGGQAIWLSHYCKTYPIELDEVYVQPRAGRSFSAAVFPMASDAKCPAVINGGETTWPYHTVTGSVHEGAPDVDFVPEGLAGLNYVSPGYNP